MPDPADADALLKAHLPVLRYDSQGSFMADSAAILTNRISPAGVPNVLKRANGTVIADAKGGPRRPRLGLDFLGSPKYGDGQDARPSDFLDAVGKDYVAQAREMHRDEFANRIYGRAKPDGGGWWLQYWFFYLYNDKAFLGFGKHEGDWEMVQVRLENGKGPVSMAFAQHKGGQRFDWGAVQKDGQRPNVYVARGSQASYATRGRHEAPFVPDYADGQGQQVEDSTLVTVGPATGTAWLEWAGRWGSTKARITKAEADSPPGPAHQPKWADPAAFHESCEEIDPRLMAPAPVPPGPPRPDIAARREGAHAIISYAFPELDSQPTPVALVVSLDSPEDELPPATYTEEIEVLSGSFEHPLDLEDKRYDVRASASDDHGNMSEQAVAELA